MISDVKSVGFEADPGGASADTQLTYLFTQDVIESGDTIMFGLVIAMGSNASGAQTAYTGSIENCYDLDGDGFENDLSAGDDCDDTDAEVSPDADEIWYDGVDQDCGKDDDYDADGDGYVPDEYEGLKTYNSETGSAIGGTGTADGGDCDDTDEDVHAGADEDWYNSIDEDCGGDSDYDQDGDGYVDDAYEGLPTYDPSTGEIVEDGTSTEAGDCDDSDDEVYTGAEETWYDGIDEDCLGDSDYDQDGDGYTPLEYEGLPTYDPGTGAIVEDGELAGGDCDDTDDEISPDEAETWYDGIDSDCAGDDDYDADGDGYVPDGYEGLPTYTTEGDLVAGTGGLESGDCDDNDFSTNPDADETWYDGLDEDCQGDDDYDQDGDSYVPDEYEGTPTTDSLGNEVAGTGEAPGGDCEDDDPEVNPGAEDKWYDGIDSDCEGNSDFDADRDGHDSDLYGGDDCNDNDDNTRPEVVETWYDGIDSDCAEDDDFDQDGDGFVAAEYAGLPTYATNGQVVAGTGVGEGGDCNDEDANIHPGADDTWYDGIDSNCEGDDDYDQDGDGRVYAAYQGLTTSTSSQDPDSTIVAGTGVAARGECDDTNPEIPNMLPCTEGGKPATGCGCSTPATPTGVNLPGLMVLAAIGRVRRRRSRIHLRHAITLALTLAGLVTSSEANAGYGDSKSGARSHEELDLFTWIEATYAGVDDVISDDPSCSVDSMPTWALDPGRPPYLDTEADKRADDRIAEIDDECGTSDSFCVLSSDELYFVARLTTSDFSSQNILSHQILCDESLSMVLIGVEEAPMGLALQPSTPASGAEAVQNGADSKTTWFISVDRTGAGGIVPYAPLRSGLCSQASRSCRAVWYGETNADATPTLLQVTDGVNSFDMFASICDTNPILFELVVPSYPASGASFVPGRGCEPYWFVWETSDAIRGTFPEEGALVGEDCSAPATPWTERPIPRAFFCGVGEASTMLSSALPGLVLVALRRRRRCARRIV